MAEIFVAVVIFGLVGVFVVAIKKQIKQGNTVPIKQYKMFIEDEKADTSDKSEEKKP